MGWMARWISCWNWKTIRMKSVGIKYRQMVGVKINQLFFSFLYNHGSGNPKFWGLFGTHEIFYNNYFPCEKNLKLDPQSELNVL
jgi:hypothetical protein